LDPVGWGSRTEDGPRRRSFQKLSRCRASSAAPSYLPRSLAYAANAKRRVGGWRRRFGAAGLRDGGIVCGERGLFRVLGWRGPKVPRPPGFSACSPIFDDVAFCSPCTVGSFGTPACGTDAFINCPTSETGQCNDGVNNDAWLDDLTDCRDPDCFTDPACLAAPAMSRTTLLFLVLTLVGLAAFTLAWRRKQAV